MTPRTPLVIAAIGTAAVAAYAAWAAVQILVLNPLAAMPGRSLAEIHADMDAAGQGVSIASTIGLLAVGVVLAIAALAVVIGRPGIPARAVAAVYLALLIAGALGYWFAAFSWGMSLADTYGISGGDHSPWARPLYAVSVAALAGLVAVGVTAGTKRPTLAAA